MTEAAEWRTRGEKDPHGDMYNRTRDSLTLGDMTDDHLANAVFLYGDTQPSIQDMLAGTAKMPIVYLTAAKERIRWLSRRVEGKLGSNAKDLLWNGFGTGRLPEFKWAGFKMVQVADSEDYCLVGVADKEYLLHTCSRPEAQERLIVLEKLL